MKVLVFIVLLALSISCKEKKTLLSSLDSSETNIDFQNKLTPTADLNILSYLYFYNGSGVSTGDFNNDGLADLYFTSNQSPDKLFINQGNFKFKDVTDASGIDNATSWTTGSTTVDINNDGLLDVYISKVSEYNNIKGHNLLYVNQGNVDGIPSFKEESVKFGLDSKGFSTHSVFFDYDQDEDLDLFLLNHSIHPNRNFGLGKQREVKDSLSGDRLLRNDNGIFKDVSSEAGIYQGKIGYGLGVSVGDVNNDGFPDIYVGNDFFENDYLYINQKNGTFKEIISEDGQFLGHTSHFSMGNSIDDLNNDGLLDIVSLDMLPEDIVTYKSSGIEYPYSTYERFLKNGYTPQFMQNTLHINNGDAGFSEIGHLSGIAASEWSWSPIVADLDNDGYKDIYVTNGILGATNDMDFINFISNDSIQKRLGANMDPEDLSFADAMPTKKLVNYLFNNNGDNSFSNVTKKWTNTKESYSNGGIQVDLDNDGDLDVVVNNINEAALILKNNAIETENRNNFISVEFKGPNTNRLGIGTKVLAYHRGNIQYQENYTTKGYLSSVMPIVHFGLGQNIQLDSLEVIWPGGKFEVLRNVKANQRIKVDYEQASGNYYSKPSKTKESGFLANIAPLLNFKHQDPTSLEFDREPLIPFASTNKGPKSAVADINNDGLEDIFICGGKSQSSGLFLQSETGSFNEIDETLFAQDAINEDTDALFFDADGNGFKDLLVVSGGNEFRSGNQLKPRLYLNDNGILTKSLTQFKDIELNASSISVVDLENDGDLDILITADLIPWQFGNTPEQYLFENDGKGNFTDISSSFGKELRLIGNVTSAQWTDLNNDGFKDLVVVGQWMPITIFMNNGKELILQEHNNLSNSSGWWNSIAIHDFDKDGDSDFIAGNWGLNTRLKASEQEPITLLSADFDDNGKVDPVVTYYYQGKETPFASKDELVKQLPFLNKKFLSYQDFAKATLSELFPKEKIEKSFRKQVFELANCYFENNGDGSFERHELPLLSQISSINDIAIDDYNNDGFQDAFLVGNNYEISTQLGKLDASHGIILLNDEEGFFKVHVNPNFEVSGPARDIENIKVNDEEYYLITMNNDVPVFLKKNKN